METQRGAFVHEPGKGRSVWCVGAYSRVLAEGSRTGGAYGMVEDLTPSGSGAPMHRHAEDDEAFYVLEGEISFFIEGTPRISAGPGWFIHVPGGMVHGFRVEIGNCPTSDHHYPAPRRFLPLDVRPGRAKRTAATRGAGLRANRGRLRAIWCRVHRRMARGLAWTSPFPDETPCTGDTLLDVRSNGLVTPGLARSFSVPDCVPEAGLMCGAVQRS